MRMRRWREVPRRAAPVVQSPESLRHIQQDRSKGRKWRRIAMGRLGLPEMLVILAIIIIIFGASRLPEIGRGIGSAIRNFRDETKDKL